MLSKLLTTTALSSVLSQVGAQGGIEHFQGSERFEKLYNDYACMLANMTPGDAADYHSDWVNDLIVHEDMSNVRDRNAFVSVSGEQLVASAALECERVTNLPGCDEVENASPGANCRQLNQAAISTIIGGYGCWGNFPTADQITASGNAAFSSLIANGRGPPKDDLDRAARDLTQAYKCIMEEAILENNTPCNPWETLYFPVTPPAFSSGGIQGWTAQCELNHGTAGGPPTCQVKACLVETLFVAKYIAWTYTVMNANNGYQVPNDDTTYYHATAAWNTQKTYSGSNPQFVNNAANCPPTGSVIHVYCCGAYPFRQRLHSATTTDQCCNGEVYNDTTHRCCGDQYYMGDVGTVETIGTTC